MEVLLLLFLIILLVMLVRVENKRTADSNEAHHNSVRVFKELSDIKKELERISSPAQPTVSNWNIPTEKNPSNIAPVVAPPPPPKTSPNPGADKSQNTEPERTIPNKEGLKQPLPEAIPHPLASILNTSQGATKPKDAHVHATVPPAYKNVAEQPDFWTRFLERNPDLEKFVGENLINKIGIAVLVLGIAFFVKYAIDQNWINEVGRVCIGIACGAGLVGIAHYLRNSYRSFSSVLAGGGIAVFYFTIAFAFHNYHLMSQTAAFVIMVVITGFAIALALLYDKLELAIIATVGGFITPFLLSTGDGNYIVLFVYLIILNTGLLTLAYFKKWLPLNLIALAFTIVIFGGWLTMKCIPAAQDPMLANALLFATVFYLLFVGMNIINPLRNKTLFKKLDFSILLAVNTLYFSAGMAITALYATGKWKGLYTVWVGVINLVLAWIFFKRTEQDKKLIYLLIGLTLTFFTLAVPVQLHGNTITMFWSAEFVLLYWLYMQSHIKLYKIGSGIIAILSLISLLMDWSQAGIGIEKLAVLYTDIKGLATNLLSIFAFAGLAQLLRNNSEGEYVLEIKNKAAANIAIIISAGITYLTIMFGINLICNSYHYDYDVANVYHRLVHLLLSVAVITYLIKKTDSKIKFTTIVTLLVYCFAYHILSINQIIHLRTYTIQGKLAAVHYIFHWIDVCLLIWLLYTTVKYLASTDMLRAKAKPACTWAFSIATLLLLSLECWHLYISFLYENGNTHALTYQYRKAGLTILWTICSFLFMWLGMKYKYKTLRLISLSIFAVVLAKLFLFDIRGISEGGKIAAFILLGVLLLTVSFMYQKLKKMLIDDKE